MLLAARNAMLTGGEKLPYDARVEYLESDGNQKITSLFPYFSDFEIGVRCTTTIDKSANAVLGSYRPARLSVLLDSQCWQLFYGVSTPITTDILATTYIDASYRNGAFAVNGTVIANHENAFYNRPMGLFSMAETTTYSTEARVYYLRIYDNNGNLARDMYPVRVGSGSNAVGYMYDIANPTDGPLGNGLFGNTFDGQGGKAGFPSNLIGPDK